MKNRVLSVLIALSLLILSASVGFWIGYYYVVYNAEVSENVLVIDGQAHEYN